MNKPLIVDFGRITNLSELFTHLLSTTSSWNLSQFKTQVKVIQFSGNNAGKNGNDPCDSYERSRYVSSHSKFEQMNSNGTVKSASNADQPKEGDVEVRVANVITGITVQLLAIIVVLTLREKMRQTYKSRTDEYAI
uniref:Uncharacterized protein n=1 Tax=Glossina pallidipes TaxID=7398 RepID=A0A1A9ZHU3_GLOPL